MAKRISVAVRSVWLALSGLSFLAGGLNLVACSSADSTRVSRLELRVPVEPGSAAASLADSHPIVFSSDATAPERPDIYLLALEGDTQQVTRAGTVYEPRWSPSGRAIAFREQVENTYAEIGLVHPDGSERVLLTSGEEAIFGEFPPNWAPDEAGLAYASRQVPETTRIRLVPRDGGPSQPLFEEDTVERRELAWSADGQRLAYADYDRAAATHGDGVSKDIWVADVATPSLAVNLTQGKVHGPVFLQWSPRDSRIVFQGYARTADGRLEGVGAHEMAGPYLPPDVETFLVDADTGSLTRVTDDGADERGVTWSPDATSLLVSSQRDGDYDLWLIPLDEPEQARNLIDDAADPHDDTAPDWFRGKR